MIQRGSTTAIPFDIYGTPLEGISEIYATFVQKGRPIAEKTYSDGKIDIEEGRLIVKLTQGDTLALDSAYNVEMQIRIKYKNGSTVASNIMDSTVGRLLKEGAI